MSDTMNDETRKRPKTNLLERLMASPWPAVVVILGAIGTTWYDVRSEMQAIRQEMQTDRAEASADRRAFQDTLQADRRAFQNALQADRRAFQDGLQAQREALQVQREEAAVDRRRFEAELLKLTAGQARLAAIVDSTD